MHGASDSAHWQRQMPAVPLLRSLATVTALQVGPQAQAYLPRLGMHWQWLRVDGFVLVGV